MDKHDGEIGTATDLLSHYLKTVWLTVGLNWNSDNQAEIETLVAALIQASVSEVNRLASENQAAVGEQRFGRIGGLKG